jgi:hypothetical protein
MTTIAPGFEILTVDAGQIATIVLSPDAVATWSFIGAQPGLGDLPTGANSLSAGATIVLGPWTANKRIRVEISRASETSVVSVPTNPFSVLFGKVDSFVGNRVLISDDNGRLLRCDDSSNVIITVPNNLLEGFNIGFLTWGTGTLTISAGSGATNRSSTSGLHFQFNAGSLVVAKNANGISAEFILGGDFV